MNLITWNIQRGRGPQGKCSIARTVADLQAMGDFDVMCLQEVSAGYTDLPGCDGSNQFIELAQRLPDYAPVAALASDTLGEGGTRRLFGSMILSRYPVLQVFRHSLPWPMDSAVMSMQRVALELTLDTPLGILGVTTTHLEYFSPMQRGAQIERLRELHREAAQHAGKPRKAGAADGPFCGTPRGGASILAGDWNFVPGSTEYYQLQAPFEDGTSAYRDAWQLLHGGRTHQATVCRHAKPERPADPVTLDLIFVSDELAGKVADVRVQTNDFGPDHQPVVLGLG